MPMIEAQRASILAPHDHRHISYVCVLQPRRASEAFEYLLLGRSLELDHPFFGHSPTVFHLDALRLGPLTDLRGIQPAARSPAPRPGGPTGITVGTASPQIASDSSCCSRFDFRTSFSLGG